MKTDNNRASKEIPPHWKKFFTEGIIDKITNKVSNDIYCIYTNYENEGQNNKGIYSYIIGIEVKSFDDVPENLDSVIIPKSTYQIFPSENKPEKIEKKWLEIWQYDFAKARTFLLEFEKYYENGKLDICIGVKP